MVPVCRRKVHALQSSSTYQKKIEQHERLGYFCHSTSLGCGWSQNRAAELAWPKGKNNMGTPYGIELNNTMRMVAPVEFLSTNWLLRKSFYLMACSAIPWMRMPKKPVHRYPVPFSSHPMILERCACTKLTLTYEITV